MFTMGSPLSHRLVLRARSEHQAKSCMGRASPSGTGDRRTDERSGWLGSAQRSGKQVGLLQLVHGVASRGR
jgi:hypothetical protein